PLRAVEAQAMAICERDFAEQRRLPWTLELRSVVDAMNRMTRKLKEMFDEQAAAMQRVRNDAYRDPLTGLANRRYFHMQLCNLIESSQRFESGAVLFVELAEFKRYNDEHGYIAGDRLLQSVSQAVTRATVAMPHLDCFAAHLAGGSFALVASDLLETDAREL